MAEDLFDHGQHARVFDKADSITFGTPDAHRAALASLVNLPP